MLTIIWLICGIIAAYIAYKKGEGVAGFLVGIILGPIAIPFVLLSKGKTKTCPYCKENIKVDALRCPRCQKDLDGPLSIKKEVKQYHILGKQISSKKILLILLGVFVLIYFAFAFMSSNSAFRDTNTSTPDTNTPTTPASTSGQSICDSLGGADAIRKTTTTVSYKELDKNPDSFTGKLIKFTGKVIQIQESGTGGFIRLGVTKDYFGWSSSDVLYVQYDGHTDILQDDVVSAYGPLAGSITYTSQANFQITIPSMFGCVIEKATQAAQNTPAPSTPTTPSQVVQPQTQPSLPSAPKTWHTVTAFNGTSDQNTDPFTIKGDQWRIRWAANVPLDSSYCTTYGCSATFAIYKTDGTIVDYFSTPDLTTTNGNGVNNEYGKTGNFYFKVSPGSISLWSLTVEDYY